MTSKSWPSDQKTVSDDHLKIQQTGSLMAKQAISSAKLDD